METKEEIVSKLPPLDLTGVVFYLLLLPWILSLLQKLLWGGRGDLWPILVGLLLFQVFNAIVHRHAFLLPRLDRSSVGLFTNTCVSLIHSSMVGLSVMFILGKEWCQNGPFMFKHEELFFGRWPGARTVLCLSTGYFVYDQIDMLRRHLYNPLAPSLLVHHAVLLVCFTLALYREVTINYLILTLFCELHSIFLHLRRVLRMAGLRDDHSWLVKIEWGCNWITFFTSRIAMHVFITCKLLQDASKFPSGLEWPLAMAGMTGLNVLNAILGADLYKAFRKDTGVPKEQLKAN